jgi:hypothetical protein
MKTFGTMMAFLVVLGGMVSQASAQSRNRKTFSKVTVGQGTVVGGYLGERSGAGNLGSYSAPTGRLRSSIYDAGSQRGSNVSRGVSSYSNQFSASSSIGGGHTRSVRIGGGSTGGGGAMANILRTPQAAPTLPMTYQPMLYRGSDDWKNKALSENIVAPTISGAHAHMLALQGATAEASQGRQAITTLVPDRAGIYRNLMVQAEEAFQNRQTARALDKYELARQVSSNSPESNLGLMLSSFATKGIDYRLEAFYLMQALEQFPELPSIRFRPRKLYRDEQYYNADMRRLRLYIEENPLDARALLVEAYMLWTEEDVPAAVKALQQAHEQAGGSDLNEAILSLWDGMASTGEVAGTIEKPMFPSADGHGEGVEESAPASQPAETNPAD